jgi:hypothetical protein
MKMSRYAAVAALMAALFAWKSQAADLVISDPRWLQMSDADRRSLHQKLSAAGAIDPSDRVVYKEIEPTAPSRRGLGFASTLPALAAGICKIKNMINTQNCSDKPEPERHACLAAEQGRYESTKAACQ